MSTCSFCRKEKRRLPINDTFCSYDCAIPDYLSQGGLEDKSFAIKKIREWWKLTFILDEDPDIIIIDTTKLKQSEIDKIRSFLRLQK